MKRHELTNAYSPVPQAFHDALLFALSEARAERPGKRRRLSLLAAVLIVALLCGTALALINYYSVRDYQGGGKPSAEFEKHILTLNQTYENDYITLTMGDTVSDGKSIALTMNISSKDESKPVFLYPVLEGYSGGRRLDIEVMGMRGLDQSGFLYPNLLEGDVLDHQYGLDATLFDDAADEDIQWMFTMRVLTPNWPILNNATELHGDQNDPPMEEYMQSFRDAYANQHIMVTYGGELVAYEAVLPTPEGMTEEEWYDLRLPDRLVLSGAFTLADTIECSFTTELPEVVSVSGQTYTLPNYTVSLKSLSLSFMSLFFELEREYPSAEAAEADRQYDWYELRDEKGIVLELTSGAMQVNGDKMEFLCSSDLLPIYPSGGIHERPASLTFIPTGCGDDHQTIYDETHAFTVELPIDR